MIVLNTSLGQIKIELDYDKAPRTALNFYNYAKKGFYDGTIFHRVIKGFMIQGGGFDTDFKEKDTDKPIENEAYNGLKNDEGTIAMARTPDPHSASSQFFINAVDNTFLNFKDKTPSGWGYCVFGKVVDGLDVVHKIEVVKTKSKGMHDDVPKENVVIEKCEIEGDDDEKKAKAAEERLKAEKEEKDKKEEKADKKQAGEQGRAPRKFFGLSLKSIFEGRKLSFKGKPAH